jgi:AraC family transcriptional regulator, transcriptional activator of pobA
MSQHTMTSQVQAAPDASAGLPVSSTDMKYFFNIETIESVNRNRDPENAPVRRPHYQIIWIREGSGYFSIDLEKYQINNNAAYTIPPGRFHQFMPRSRLSGYVLSFNMDFLNLAIESPGRSFYTEITSGLKQVKMYLPKPGDQAFQNVLADISREFKASLMLRLEILSGLFKVFLIYMKRQSAKVFQEDAICPNSRLFNSFYAKLDHPFTTRKQVADYARELFVSPNYLSDVVRKVTGHPASYYIRQRTVQEAKRLIMYNDANMKMVASSLGFEDLSHFSKYFKNAAGMNFTAFRKKTFTRPVN